MKIMTISAHIVDLTEIDATQEKHTPLDNCNLYTYALVRVKL